MDPNPVLRGLAMDTIDTICETYDAEKQEASRRVLIGSKIYAISAHFADKNDAAIHAYASRVYTDDTPSEGSIGVNWRVNEDLQSVYERFKEDRNGLVRYLKTECKTFLGEARPSGQEASQLADCLLFFNNPDQKYFFIKKGKCCQYLCRKTSNYYFSERDGQDPELHMPHRVRYSVIRKATEEESKAQGGPATLFKGALVRA